VVARDVVDDVVELASSSTCMAAGVVGVLSPGVDGWNSASSGATATVVADASATASASVCRVRFATWDSVSARGASSSRTRLRGFMSISIANSMAGDE